MHSNRSKLLLLAVPLFIMVSLIAVALVSSEPKKIKNKEVIASKQETADKEVKGARITSSPTPTVSDFLPRSLEEGKIVKVVDGDTISVNISGQTQTIRVIGINTPETVDPRTGIECFGIEASAFAKDFFSKNSTIFLERDDSQSERDKYNRLLRYVFVNGGSQDFGLMMIKNGYAYEYTYDVPYKYQSIYKDAQKSAETNGLGLWADGSCNKSSSSSEVNGASVSVTNGPGISGDKDCSDFGTQKEAQDFFIVSGGPASDPHKLDSDKDGSVCESLP